MFIDSAKILVKGGDGGKGCRSFYRDKYTRDGVPDGGPGGRGADVIIEADRNLRTLIDFKYNRHFYGHNGAQGSGNNKNGKDSPTVIIRMPCGVVITDVGTNCVLGSLLKDKERLMVAKGGKGGLGNTHKHEATPGEPDEVRELQLDLKLIADVGIIGFPNAGKSTLISNISRARSAIAPYPFTTRFPVLGMVGEMDEKFVVADIPGLIEGSSEGRGLGDKFLRHVERTTVLLHLIDMSGLEGRDPVKDYRAINKELSAYSKELAKKPQVIAANKMDLESSKLNLARFKKAIKKKVYPISALHAQGLEELIAAIRKKL